MSLNIAGIFTNISDQNLELAVSSGLLLASAGAAMYLFFGRLFSLPELIGIILRKPTSELSRNSLIVISGFVFISALLRTLYHEHLTTFFPYDDQQYLNSIQSLRLIICGSLVGLGSQIAITGLQQTGTLGIPTFSLRSFVSSLLFFGTAIVSVTFKFYKMIPGTPRIIQIADQSLPNNISFDSYLLVTLITPFICMILSSKKSLKGMIESLIHFGVGVAVGCFILLFQWSQIQTTFQKFKFSKKWTGQMLVAFTVASIAFGVVFVIVKYGLQLLYILSKKPLFANTLQDKKGAISFRLILGCLLTGLGLGMGGLIFQSFLLTIPSSSLRLIVFWGVPCVFCMKTVQVVLDKQKIN